MDGALAWHRLVMASGWDKVAGQGAAHVNLDLGENLNRRAMRGLFLRVPKEVMRRISVLWRSAKSPPRGVMPDSPPIW